MTERWVRNYRLRRAFLASGLQPAEVAVRAGVTRSTRRRRPRAAPRTDGDATTVLRELGLKPTETGKYRRTIPEARALKYVEALGLYPVDVGL